MIPVATDIESPSTAIEFGIADDDDRVGLSAGAADDGAQTGNKLLHAERLGQVVIGADLEADDAVDLLGLGGEHQDGDARGGAQASAQAQAVLAREHQVEHDEVGLVGLERLDRARAVVGLVHGVTLGPQPVEDFIGPQRPMLFQQDFQHPPADRGQLQPVGRAMRVDMRHRPRDAAGVVVGGGVVDGGVGNVALRHRRPPPLTAEML